MKTFTKILIGSIAFIVITLLALFIVLANIDLNNHKDTISKKVQQLTGYQLTLAGDIQHSLYPWLGIATEDITIDDPADADAAPLFSAATLKMRIKLLPLLRRRIEIDTLHLKKARLRLKKEMYKQPVNTAPTQTEGQGTGLLITQEQQPTAKSNKGPQPKQREKIALPIRGLALGGVEIQDIIVTWAGQESDQRFVLDELHLHIDPLAYEQPIKLAGTAKLALNQPYINSAIKIDGLIRYADAGSHTAIEPLTIHIDSNTLPADADPISVKTTLDLDLKNGAVALPEIHLDAAKSILRGQLQVTQLHAAPALSTTLDLFSEDVTQLFELVGMESAANQLAALADKTLKINTTISTDGKKNKLAITPFRLNLAGSDIDITAHLQGDSANIPAANGQLDVHIADLPLLMKIVAALKGTESKLLSAAKRLADLDKKSLTLAAQFDVDIKNNKINIPGIQLDALGLQLSGNIQGSDDTKGELNGELRFTSSSTLRPLLTAVDQAELGELLNSVDMTAAIHGRLPQLQLKPLVFNAQLVDNDPQTPPDIARLDTDLTLDMAKQTLDVTRLSITGLGLNIDASLTQQIDAATFSGELSMAAVNLRALARRLNRPLALTESTALNKVALNKLAFHGTGQQFTIKELEAILDDTLIQGELSIDFFKRAAYRFGLNIDTLDIDRYLPAQSKGRPITPETAVTGAATTLPIETLRGLDIKGDVHIDQLSFSSIKIKDAQAHIDAKDGQIKLEPVTAQLYDGHYKATVVLDARDKETRLDINTRLSEMDLGLLLADLLGYKNLTGKGELSLSLKTQGNDVDTLKNSLSGHGKINLQKGGLNGFDAVKIAQQIKAMYESGRVVRLDKGEHTDFGSLTGTMAIAGGKIHVDDLLVRTPDLIDISGSGMLFNLKDETWDYDFKINVDDTIQLLVQCDGKLAKKRCRPNVQDIIKKSLKNKLKEKIDRLKIKIPGIRLKEL